MISAHYFLFYWALSVNEASQQLGMNLVCFRDNWAMSALLSHCFYFHNLTIWGTSNRSATTKARNEMIAVLFNRNITDHFSPLELQICIFDWQEGQQQQQQKKRALPIFNVEDRKWLNIRRKRRNSSQFIWFLTKSQSWRLNGWPGE